MRKKILALLLAGLMVMSMAACGGNDSGNANDGSTGSDTPAADNSSSAADDSTSDPSTGSYTIGICQLMEHEALDAATKGFQDALTDALGDSITYEYQNAQGDAATCATIINGFVSGGVDLILANATPALQAAAAGTSEIPILGTSVTEYGVALSIDDFDGTVGGNISGTSDLAPLAEQAAMIKEWLPDVQNIGLLYCSAEQNSQYQVDVVKAELEKLGCKATLYAFSDSNDLSAVCTTAASENEVLYVPTDNTAANNTGIIDNICRPAKVPVFCGEEGIARGCGVATLSISYYDLGRTTGEMAVSILTGKEDISAMPIAYTTVTKKYNANICEELGITVPEGYEAIETEEA
ncbi:MAG: ABC transporter substrate-binding protein [Clostridiaceae bacterium]|nr:ABC transporter substrate-binding protein [Clostridiaceae bacterium]